MGTIEALIARLAGQRVYIDSNFFIYFLSGAQPWFDAVVPVFQACDAGRFAGFTGDAAVAEVMVHPYRSKNPSEIARVKSLFSRAGFVSVLAHDAAAFDLAAQCRAESKLRMIDAVHYATALGAGCRFLLTNDHGFKAVGGLEVISIESLLDR